ncbi:hypothetical protein C0989_006168 [Termitomyces sp. Mn162]|nr:hypothetical protein C0989_006168 [Termitomyces sp. Mn162]
MSSFAFASAAWASSCDLFIQFTNLFTASFSKGWAWSSKPMCVLTGVKEEWGKLDGCVNMVVVLEFGIREEFIPVILALVAEEAEILFQLLVYMLHLAIGLWMVGSGGVELYSKQLVELAGELHHEMQSLI